MSSQIYKVDFKRLAIMLTPLSLRKSVLLNFLYVMATQLANVANVFANFRRDTNYRLTHNGQVCYLRAVVNDFFDQELRRITIEDLEAVEGIYLYQETEQATLHPQEPNTILLSQEGFSDGGYDFTISVPQELQQEIDLPRFRAIVNQYKLVSKRYIIVFV